MVASLPLGWLDSATALLSVLDRFAEETIFGVPFQGLDTSCSSCCCIGWLIQRIRFASEEGSVTRSAEFQGSGEATATRFAAAKKPRNCLGVDRLGVSEWWHSTSCYAPCEGVCRYQRKWWRRRKRGNETLYHVIYQLSASLPLQTKLLNAHGSNVGIII